MPRRPLPTLLLGLAAAACACAGSAAAERPDATATTNSPATANVISVRTSGRAGAYTFAVEIRSPDTGCERFADWWEVVSADGALLHRRILLHSHVDEQPFTRSGGPVATSSAAKVWVRAHLSTGGYGVALSGSPAAGFSEGAPPAGFAAALEQAAPQPTGCAF